MTRLDQRLLEEQVVAAFGQGLTTLMHPDGSAVLVLPLPLEDGELVTVRVSIDHDQARVDDRAMAAVRLDEAGVNLSTSGRAGRSWARLRSTLDQMSRPGEFELSKTVDVQDVGQAVLDVATAVLRADQLRVLAETRQPRSFYDEVKRELARSVALEVNAKILTRSGHERLVTCKIVEPGAAEVYVMGLAGGGHRDQRIERADRTYSVFGQSNVDRDQRAAVLESQAERWEPWLIQGLGEVASVWNDVEIPVLSGAVKATHGHVPPRVPSMA